jgi:Zn finger protein HypA/HybF involved in hydrogenase expression
MKVEEANGVCKDCSKYYNLSMNKHNYKCSSCLILALSNTADVTGGKPSLRCKYY